MPSLIRVYCMCKMQLVLHELLTLPFSKNALLSAFSISANNTIHPCNIHNGVTTCCPQVWELWEGLEALIFRFVDINNVNSPNHGLVQATNLRPLNQNQERLTTLVTLWAGPNDLHTPELLFPQWFRPKHLDSLLIPLVILLFFSHFHPLASPGNLTPNRIPISPPPLSPSL